MTRIVVVLADRTPNADATPGVVEQIERVVTNRAPTASLHKMHEGHPSAELDAFWEVDVAADQADEVLAELRSIAGVDGAYVKPLDEAP